MDLPIKLVHIKGTTNPADALTRQFESEVILNPRHQKSRVQEPAQNILTITTTTTTATTEGILPLPLPVVNFGVNNQTTHTQLSDDLLTRTRWKEMYLKDEILSKYFLARSQKILSINVPKDILLSGGLLRQGGKVMVPSPLHVDLLQAAHDDVGHMGKNKTLHRLQHYTWPGMTNDVIEYIRSCPTCQMNKIKYRLPNTSTPLQPAE